MLSQQAGVAVLLEKFSVIVDDIIEILGKNIWLNRIMPQKMKTLQKNG